MTAAWRLAGRGLLSLLFPARCVLCGAAHEEEVPWLCAGCREAAERAAAPRIERVATGLRVFSGWIFAEPLREIVHQLKYRQHPSLAPWLGGALAQLAAGAGFLRGDEVLVPVPLHRRRLAERGFNQSERMARGVQAVLPGCSVISALARRRHTAVQATLSREERLENVRGAFVLRRGALPLGAASRIVLIDDVVTTGATLSACAGALAAFAPEEILGLTVCRAPLA